MSTPHDTFTGFLEILPQCLDGPAPTADEVAARLFLSRFHCDRLISAAAGEPPATLRRRVLLERAAFQLIATRQTVLDVAIAAGYTSHEAFSRAFTRAFGRTPTAWRAAPGQIRLAAPNGVHFHPPSGLRLPGRRKETEMDLLKNMVAHHVWTTGQIVKGAATLSDAELDAPLTISVDPDEDVRSLRSLCSRLIGQMDMWMAAIESRSYDWSVEEHESVTSLRERFGRVAPAFRAEVDEVIESGRLDDTFVDALCESAEVFTYGGMIAHVLNFSAYRRTLAVLRLRQAGYDELGWGDPMQFVAEPAA